MARLRFVAPLSDRYVISDGDWVEIKRDLTAEEEQFLKVAGLRQMSGIEGKTDPAVEVDWGAYGMARLRTYLKDWSFRDPDDKPVPVTADAIAAIDPETFEEIETVITKHRERREQEKKALKKPIGEVLPSASPSGSDAATATL
jgi:hypothetical protein